MELAIEIVEIIKKISRTNALKLGVYLTAKFDTINTFSNEYNTNHKEINICEISMWCIENIKGYSKIDAITICMLVTKHINNQISDIKVCELLIDPISK